MSKARPAVQDCACSIEKESEVLVWSVVSRRSTRAKTGPDSRPVPVAPKRGGGRMRSSSDVEAGSQARSGGGSAQERAQAQQLLGRA